MQRNPEELYALFVYVPTADAERVKVAMFTAGGGRIGAYSDCAWETTGTGQFRPLPGSTPHTGRHGTVSRVSESKIEILVSASSLDAVVAAVHRTHPYEAPACFWWPVASCSAQIGASHSDSVS